MSLFGFRHSGAHLYLGCPLFLTINVPGDIEVEIFSFNFTDRYDAAVFRHFQLLIEHIYNLMDVLVTKLVFGTSLTKPLPASIMKMAFRLAAFSLSMMMMHAGMPVPKKRLAGKPIIPLM